MKKSQIDSIRLIPESFTPSQPIGSSNPRLRPAIIWGGILLFFLCASATTAQILVGENGYFYENFTDGSGTFSGVTITANVPPDITYLTCGGAPTCSENSGEVTWDVGTLTSG